VALKGTFMFAFQIRMRISSLAMIRLSLMALCCTVGLILNLPAMAQQADTTQQPAAAPNVQQPTAPPAESPGAIPPAEAKPAISKAAGEISENELKQMLVGKPLYLRGGYLDNSLLFNEHGALIGQSAKGSCTLSGIQIEKVRLTKHKVELEGARYGLHFLGALQYENPANAVDRVRITPKKKVVRITIDREQVLVHKDKRGREGTREKNQVDKAGIPVQTAPAATAAERTTAQPATAEAPEPSEADQLKAGIAAVPAAERPADPASITATYSPTHAANILKDALDRIFAQGIDDRLVASMPECWKLYYQAQAANADYKPADSAVLRQAVVDKKARLITTFQPDSNEYAQASAVSGMALYHTVIGADGKPTEIAVGRPIGFGLDENAVAAIRKAAFEPAIKDGKPVPVVLDLVVEFHIYSKRTGTTGNPDEDGKQPDSTLPGPYSVRQ
jgi:TonB family protein